jgi:hypothetical protein
MDGGTAGTLVCRILSCSTPRACRGNRCSSGLGVCHLRPPRNAGSGDSHVGSDGADRDVALCNRFDDTGVGMELLSIAMVASRPLQFGSRSALCTPAGCTGPCGRANKLRLLASSSVRAEMLAEMGPKALTASYSTALTSHHVDPLPVHAATTAPAIHTDARVLDTGDYLPSKLP